MRLEGPAFRRVTERGQVLVQGPVESFQNAHGSGQSRPYYSRSRRTWKTAKSARPQKVALAAPASRVQRNFKFRRLVRLDVAQEIERHVNLLRPRPCHRFWGKFPGQIEGRAGQSMSDLRRRKNRDKQPDFFKSGHAFLIMVPAKKRKSSCRRSRNGF